MSRRQRPPDSFNHSPFKTLKGLPVSGPGQPPAPKPEPRPPAVPADDDHELFDQEMAWLEVRPLPGNVGEGGRKPAAVPAVPAPAEADGAGEFLAAIGRLDTTFCDEPPETEHAPGARPRRMKQLTRGELAPAGEIDLHGLLRDEAVQKTRRFLEHAVRQGWPAVLIITGKGLHSNEGPVLRQAVEGLLNATHNLVLEWGTAPRRYGGGGALVVFLRVPAKS